MNHRPDGGPAYPISGDMHYDQNDDPLFGMSLRDRVAISAMQGILSNPGSCRGSHRLVAEEAYYYYAEAMLTEKSRRDDES